MHYSMHCYKNAMHCGGVGGGGGGGGGELPCAVKCTHNRTFAYDVTA